MFFFTPGCRNLGWLVCWLVVKGGEGALWRDWHNWDAISCQRAYSEVYYGFTGKALKFKWSLAELFFFFFNLQRNAGFSFSDHHITEKKEGCGGG